MTLDLAAAEPDADNRKKAGELLGTNVYKGIEQALDESSHDVVILCSPNHLHVLQAMLALSRGCHVFVEKPLALELADAEKLASPARESEGLLMVGCNLRFHRGVRTLSEALRDGAVGRPLYAKAHFAHYLPNWRPGTDYRKTYSARKDLGGGILLDAIHEPDYLCWLFGKAKDVQGRLMNLGDLALNVEDVAMFVIAHESGVVSEVHVDYLRRDKSRGCVITGTEGTLQWESAAKNPERILVRAFDASRDRWTVLCDEPAYDLNRQYVKEMAYFLNAVAKGERPMNGLEEAMHSLALLDAVRESSKRGCRVKPVLGAQ
jgi:predicted dehydrogenase